MLKTDRTKLVSWMVIFDDMKFQRIFLFDLFFILNDSRLILPFILVLTHITDRLVSGFTTEANIKLETSSNSSSSGISSDDERSNLKRSLSQEDQNQSPKRVKHGISDILGGEEPTKVKEEPNVTAVTPSVPTAPSRTVSQDQGPYNYNLYQNFNRLQQEQAAQLSQLQQQQQYQAAQAAHQQQMLAAQQAAAARAQAQAQAQQAAGAPQQAAGVQQRYWSDAMYSLLLRAQQNQQMSDKITGQGLAGQMAGLPDTTGRVPSQHSDSGHESGNADSGSEQEVIDVQNVTGPVVNQSEAAPQPTHQVKPAWIQKRMDKLKRKRAARENGDPEIDVEGDDDDDEDVLPGAPAGDDVISGSDSGAELGPAIIGGAGTGVITKDVNGKTQISCKQCRWTLRKWESWAKKRNLGTLPGLDIKSDPNDQAPTDFLTLDTTEELVRWMSHFIREIRKDSGEAYQIDSITAFAFSLQKVLKETGRQVDILRNEKFTVFLEVIFQIFQIRKHFSFGISDI